MLSKSGAISISPRSGSLNLEKITKLHREALAPRPAQQAAIAAAAASWNAIVAPRSTVNAATPVLGSKSKSILGSATGLAKPLSFRRQGPPPFCDWIDTDSRRCARQLAATSKQPRAQRPEKDPSAHSGGSAGSGSM